MEPTEDTEPFVNGIVEKVRTLGLFQRTPDIIRVDYPASLGRLTFYFVDKVNKHILTIKTEYGTPIGPEKTGSLVEWSQQW